MAIQFKEIRQYLARNARLSICFEDGYYQDYDVLMTEVANGFFYNGGGKITLK